MVDLSTYPNWVRSSSSRQSMDGITTTSGKPHKFSGPTGLYVFYRETVRDSKIVFRRPIFRNR